MYLGMHAHTTKKYPFDMLLVKIGEIELIFTSQN